MFQKRFIIFGGTITSLAFIVFLGIRHYDYNVSALFHMDTAFGERNRVPQGLVLYEDAGYDGMLYYQVARDIPSLFTGGVTSLDSPYRFQRILLPLLVFKVTLGQERFFPYAFLIINLFASLATLVLMIAITKKTNIHTLTVIFNPAILVGILYSLTEPLSTFFIVLFLYFWEKNNRKVHAWGLIALLLSLLARETTIFLVGLLFLWYLWKKQWKQAALLVLPIILFILWQYFLVLRLGSVPFQANSNVVSTPLTGPITLLLWITQGLTSYRLSSVGLLLFVLPLSFVLGKEWTQKKMAIDVYAFLLTGLILTMFSMDAHMWGAITSIGRVVTPIYPVYALFVSARDTWLTRAISTILIGVSIVAIIGIASARHPFILS